MITTKTAVFEQVFRDNDPVNTYAVLYKNNHEFNVRTDDIQRWFISWAAYHQKMSEASYYTFKMLPDNEQPKIGGEFIQ